MRPTISASVYIIRQVVTRLSPLSDQRSLQERTYQALRNALINGQYLPGERIYEAAAVASSAPRIR